MEAEDGAVGRRLPPEADMSRGAIFWILMILWALSVVFGVKLFAENAVYVSTGLLLVLFGLLGWQVFGPAIKG